MEPNNNMQPSTSGSAPIPNPEPMKPVNMPNQDTSTVPMSEPQVVPAYSSKPMMSESKPIMTEPEPMKPLDLTQIPKNDGSMTSSEVFGNKSVQPDTMMPQAPMKKKSIKNIAIIIALIVVVIVIAVVAWLSF